MPHRFHNGILVHETHRVPKPMMELCSLIGDFIQYWGFKKIHGQIWTTVFLSKEPIDATTLVKRLRVSKALVSLAIKDLLEFEVIQVAGKGSRRKTLYQSHPDLIYVISRVLVAREKKLLEQIKTKQNELNDLLKESKENLDICPDKMGELDDMVSSAQDMLSVLVSSGLVGSFNSKS
jgi:DNA-binding transcriptional regulator GbsR (MarR family)